MTVKLYKKTCRLCGDTEHKDSKDHGQCYGGDLHKWEVVESRGIIECESCREMVAYVDEAKKEATKRGRIQGEPLWQWIARLPKSVELPVTEAYEHGYLMAYLIAKQLDDEDFAKWEPNQFICLDCGVMTFKPVYGCIHMKAAARPSAASFRASGIADPAAEDEEGERTR